ncbi:unnamed protein product [Amoebophrya sp. A120]|nr:unnamed protein product [Amoebophrya sp. A120]|eukprot:GSA120T00003058001.1
MDQAAKALKEASEEAQKAATRNKIPYQKLLFAWTLTYDDDKQLRDRVPPPSTTATRIFACIQVALLLAQSPILDVGRMSRFFKSIDALGRASGALQDVLYVRYRLEVSAGDVAKAGVDRVLQQDVFRGVFPQVGKLDPEKEIWKSYTSKNWVEHSVELEKPSDILTMDEIRQSGIDVNWVIQIFSAPWDLVHTTLMAPLHTGYVTIKAEENSTSGQLMEIAMKAFEKHEENSGAKQISEEFLEAITQLNVDKHDLLLQGMGLKIARKLQLVRCFDVGCHKMRNKLLPKEWGEVELGLTESLESGGLFSYYHHLETKEVSWEAPNVMELNPLWRDPGIEIGETPETGRPYFKPKDTNEVSYDAPFSLDLVIAAIYATVLKLYSTYYITTFFAIISDEPSTIMQEEATGVACGSRTVLWYLKCVGECWDSVIFDPSHQDGTGLEKKFPKTHYHQRGAGFMGFAQRRDAEEYLHLLYQWDREHAKDPDSTKLTSDYAKGSWKVWIFYLHEPTTARAMFDSGHLILGKDMPAALDWVTKYKKKGKKMTVSHWENKYTKEISKTKPMQSRIPMVRENWYIEEDNKGRKRWRNKITREISLKKPKGPDANRDVWTEKMNNRTGKKSWTNPYTKQTVYKNPLKTKSYNPMYRSYDVYEQLSDSESEEAIYVRTAGGSLMKVEGTGRHNH